MAEALYEVGCIKPELINEIIYWALREKGIPALRSMTSDLADEWAAFKVKESAARPPEEIRQLLNKHPARAYGSADAI